MLLFWFVLVAEQAESIDNPMHEAAKRGATAIYRSDFFHVLFIYCVMFLFLCSSPFNLRQFSLSGDNKNVLDLDNICFCFCWRAVWPFASICVLKQAIWAGCGNVWRTRLESTGWIRLETLPSTGDATEDIKVTMIVVHKTRTDLLSPTDTLLRQRLNVI